MLSAAAFSFRQKSRLAISLSWVAGYTNVILFILCGVVVAHTTGNVTHLGQFAAERDFGQAWRIGGFLVLLFFCGAVTSGIVTETARRRGLMSKYVLPVAMQTALLCAIGVTIAVLGLDQNSHLTYAAHPGLLYWLSGLASFAMGLQNATITKISGAVVRTTHLTGVVTDLGLESVHFVLWLRQTMRLREPRRFARLLRVARRQHAVRRIVLLGSIFGSFLVGVFAGTLAFEAYPSYALLAPVAFLLCLIVIDYRKSRSQRGQGV